LQWLQRNETRRLDQRVRQGAMGRSSALNIEHMAWWDLAELGRWKAGNRGNGNDERFFSCRFALSWKWSSEWMSFHVATARRKALLTLISKSFLLLLWTIFRQLIHYIPQGETSRFISPLFNFYLRYWIQSFDLSILICFRQFNCLILAWLWFC
jgi:hypothetical protein